MVDEKKISESTNTTSGIITKNIPESEIVTTVTLPNGLAQETFYSPATSSNEIIMDSTSSSHIELEPYYREEIIETLERSKGLLDGGIKVSFKLPDFLGGAEFNFEKRPKEETRKITREIYKSRKKEFE